ncbi:hypothetical protein SADUNF_Sadunf17G0105300 [Salix dunnii]|uniref:Nuclear matrix constituent protein 1-like protein n=1 Tax=Salix dunnii TaxID=1413687 RepID=A0A835MHK8_9ROSI|nr:hypothetical protein SADUNF_Sadunf17G0105300 [Salix dunnii]
MLTPQRKVWSGWSLTPRSEAGQKNGSESGSDPKGKSVDFVEQVTPNGVRPNLDGEDLADKVSKLENELFEYQYNMGLLLIEKKEWGSKYEELVQAFTEAKEAVKREQAAHLIALSDAEKQEENLRRALGVEKQCVLDLEKAVHDMRSENADLKFTADSKLAEANALVTSIEEKSLEVEAKLRAADAKLAEVSRKSSEIQRKLLDVESRESDLRRERLSFIAEKEVYETTFSKQREDLQEWEKKLQEGEDRLSKSQRIINQREERANENDRILKQKEKDLEEAHKKIEDANSILKRKEDDISNRLTTLTIKEKACFFIIEFDATRKKLEVKEVELRVLEEKLNERERVEIKKLTDEHNAILDAKKHEFELEAEQKKKSLEDDLKNKVIEVEKRETEIKHKEEKVAKREQALDKKLEKLKEKENEFESKSKSLKEREKAIISEQKNLEGENNQLKSAKEVFLNLKAELEKTRASNEEQLLKIHEEKDRLKVSEEERSEYARLQAELKEEINKCRIQEELLLKEVDDLKQQKRNFEREWEDLDEKRAETKKELKSICEQKEKFEKHRLSEEERIRNERKATEDYVKRELEALQVAKESFEATMDHDQSVMAEKAQNERNQMLHSIEMHKTELENELQKRQEEMDRLLQEKEKLFEEEKEREVKNINFLRDVARREMEDMKLERLRIEKEKQEVDENKRHLQEQQLEMREDIDKLGDLSRKLKDHREQFIKERERFIVFVEQNKGCKNCGELTSEFVLSDLISSLEIEKADTLPTSKLLNNHVTGDDLAASEKHDIEISPIQAHSVSPVSWLRKCTSKILRFSAGKKIEPAALQNLTDGTPLSGAQVNAEEMTKRLDFTENEQELSFAIVNDSLDAQRVLSDTSIREVEAGHDLLINDQSNNNGTALEIQEDSQPSGLKHDPQPRKRGRPRVSRTRSVKAVVQDAKTLLGDAFELNEAEDSGHLKSESRDESSLVDKGAPRSARKRNRTQTSQISVSDRYGDDSEGHSDSVTAGDRRKRRQKVVPNQTQGQTQYNLRRRKLGVAVVTAKASSNLNNEKEKEDDGVSSPQDGNLLTSAPAASAGVASENGESTHFVRCSNIMDTLDGDGSARKMDESAALSEEINGTQEGAGEYGIADENRSETPRDDNEDEDEDGDEEESVHPGEVSIGKKLWTFLTT